MTVTIHQPEHLSYLGFFHKVSRCDKLILLDTVDYEKNYFQNRNRIITPSGVRYITVPVNGGKAIKDIAISQKEWPAMRRKLLATIRQSYGKTPFFDEYYKELEAIYQKNDDKLVDLNVELLEKVLEWLRIDTVIYKASDLNCSGTKSELLANLCKAVGAERYLSGCSGRVYLDTSFFGTIEVVFQSFRHPSYAQANTMEFIPCMSVIDSLFNVGGINTMNLINQYNEK